MRVDGRMTTRTCFRLVAAFAAAAILDATSLWAQIAPKAVLKIEPSPSGSRITLTNFGNHVWILQRSPDLDVWTEVDAWKVHNGHLSQTLTNAGGKSFYRAVFDPARQDILSTT